MRKPTPGKRMPCALDVLGRRARVRCFYLTAAAPFWSMRANWGYWECGVAIS